MHHTATTPPSLATLLDYWALYRELYTSYRNSTQRVHISTYSALADMSALSAMSGQFGYTISGSELGYYIAETQFPDGAGEERGEGDSVEMRISIRDCGQRECKYRGQGDERANVGGSALLCVFGAGQWALS